ncbi:MAG: hypothetical protein COW65_17410 [Cytophagales bacterium CG18_big_fil_WC_8_21_14_2_50_42_9]|nr:MAG: hypothetical protein COW65_17410 [Cytophagales bacterium CG18_big_fil_WC_8_21_14_2_50_42_9]
MSYDLYFYKKKATHLPEEKIIDYLNNNLISTSESDTQWFVENEDTETYFSIDWDEPAIEEEDIDLFESFSDFDYTHFTFNLNFLRPDFFGQSAFGFVDRFIRDFDLYVLNPQSSIDADNPYKPNHGDLYENWAAINATHSERLFKEYELEYYPIDKSNDFYNFNLNRESIQESLGENYYVPKLYLFKTKADGKVITLATWTEHIPNVFPPADYYLLTKNYKKLFKKVEESGLISAQNLNNRFGHLLEDFEFKDCKIIHPEQASKAKDIFNLTKFEYTLKEFAERLPIEKVVNVTPTE